MLLYIGIGDAAAVPVEYVKFPEHEALRQEVLRFDKYCKHPKYSLGAGRYTDDTEMSVANARVLIENDPPYTKEMFADAWVREFHRGGKRKGYSKGFQSVLEQCSTGKDLLRILVPNSVQNGAAMRAVPLGVLPNVEDVLQVATLQASITHDTPEGRFSARAIALMSHFALYEPGPFHCFIENYLVKNLPGEDIDKFGHIFIFGNNWNSGPVVGTEFESVAIATVRAVMELCICHQQHWSLLEILKDVVQMGGDTDSVAAIALGIIGTRTNFSSTWLPPYMTVDLEDGDPHTGAKYLLDIGRQLMTKFGKGG